MGPTAGLHNVFSGKTWCECPLVPMLFMLPMQEEETDLIKTLKNEILE